MPRAKIVGRPLRKVKMPAGVLIDLITAISAAASSLGHVGPGLGRVGPLNDYAWMPAAATWLLVACMLLGRLEFLASLVLCLANFWRQ
jgi:trk system potassium uptake protein TrkH